MGASDLVMQLTHRRVYWAGATTIYRAATAGLVGDKLSRLLEIATGCV
jgi:hypothetical protein